MAEAEKVDDLWQRDGAVGDRPAQGSEPTGAPVRTLADVEGELAEMRDRWMRAEAESANVRSRAKRDVEDARQYAIQKFATDVSEAAENLRRGLDSIPAASGGEPEILSRLRDGFLGVERSFLGLLKRNGVAPEDPVGLVFDPMRHQAVSDEASDETAPGTILRALSSAWTLNGRLLRPAMVVVAKAGNIGRTADRPK